MKANNFKWMKNYINENGFDTVILHMGYLWINLTDKQVSVIRNMAIERGYLPNENGDVKIDMWVLHEV